ncbi:MAG TPA: ribosomal protein S18-alanine N-acetyltransferase [Candidatus Dormibacteraeota bacterium]|nr:ribosomal protein S18-alanine N-acetyltransferase [Candidatus Dormibacteraeota bacterium]
MEGLTIRVRQERDRAAIDAVMRRSPEAAGWAPEGDAGLACWVGETGVGVVGFVVARAVADEVEILNLAVDPSARRRGAGAALLAAALEHGRCAGARGAFLEVRQSNRAAIGFYERHGFVRTGLRRGYYRDPEEDALLMGLALPDPA